jgi:hypothetical protein
MMNDVPKADVVIVNPTPRAVALRWDRMAEERPVCVAKGVDEVALRIRAVAMETGCRSGRIRRRPEPSRHGRHRRRDPAGTLSPRRRRDPLRRRCVRKARQKGGDADAGPAPTHRWRRALPRARSRGAEADRRGGDASSRRGRCTCGSTEVAAGTELLGCAGAARVASAWDECGTAGALSSSAAPAELPCAARRPHADVARSCGASRRSASLASRSAGVPSGFLTDDVHDQHVAQDGSQSRPRGLPKRLPKQDIRSACVKLSSKPPVLA